jgi:hypothetical protein
VPIFELLEEKLPSKTLALGSEDMGSSHQAEGLALN